MLIPDNAYLCLRHFKEAIPRAECKPLLVKCEVPGILGQMTPSLWRARPQTSEFRDPVISR